MKLLIFSVAGPGDGDLSQVAALNIIRSNPSLDITFSIINNSGAPILAKYPLVNNIIIRKGIPNNNQYSPSVHHSMAINSFLATIISSHYDYYLLIDPDVIQIQMNAINTILTKMSSKNIDVYSFPWHLRWYSKYRSRTSPHFFIFSRYILNKKILDFSPLLNKKSLLSFIPSILHRLKSQSSTTLNKLPKKESYFLGNKNKLPLTTYILKLLSSFFISRFVINSAKDTGFKNSYRNLSSKGIKVEIGYMFISKKSLMNIFHLRNKFLKYIEMYFIFNRVSFLPRFNEYIYTANYEALALKTKTEMFSIDAKNIAFVHLRKFTRNSCNYDIEDIKSTFQSDLKNGSLDNSEQIQN